MYRLIIALLLLATVSQALPTNATVRMATQGYVTNKVAAGVASAVAQAGTNATASVTGHNTNATAHASLFAALATTNQLNGYFPLSGGRLNSGARLQIGDDIPYSGWLVGTYGPREVVYGGAGTPTVTMHFPDWLDGDNINIASKEWVVKQYYLTAEADTNALAQLTTHTNRTDNPHVVTAAQVGALTAQETTNAIAAETNRAIQAEAMLYPRNNPSNLTTIAAVRAMTYTNQTWGASGTNATYRMSWDIANMTFKVEEILP